MAITLDVPPVT